jgi:TonB-linked SusC/RagA family outer membrane protein
MIKNLTGILCFFLASFFTYSQIDVSGTVTDEAGGAIPGITVIIAGTNQGTTTDFDGNYSITASADQELEFSSLGFVTQRIAINNQDNIDVIMIESIEVLDEIVVSGYSTQSRRTLSGAIGSVDVADAIKTPTTNAAEALQGRVAGVNVVNSGQPGAAPVVTVRGYATTNSNNPLYVIDGVQTEDPNVLRDINPKDIDKISVLKDGAAAIYGARASNGIIVVTTKGGTYNTENTIEVEAVYGTNDLTNRMELLNSQQWADMIWQSKINDGIAPSHPQLGSGASPVLPTVLNIQMPNLPQYEGASAVVEPGGTRWMDELFKKSNTLNTSIVARGGSETGRYSLSVNYLDQEGVKIFTGYERLTTRLNSEFKIGDKVTIGEHMNVTYDKEQTGAGDFRSASGLAPIVPIRDDKGNFAGSYNNSYGLGIADSPVAQSYRAQDNYNKNLRVIGDIFVKYDITDFLTFKSSAGIQMRQLNGRSFAKLNPEHGEAISTQTLRENSFLNSEWVISNTLTYSDSFGDHAIDALIGTEAVKWSQKGSGVLRTGYLFETPEFYLLSNGSGTPVVFDGYDSSYSLFSLFATANYAFKEKYFFTATVRQDETSRFAKANADSIFPSASAGWLISDESFFPSGLVSTMKLRASYGILGNQSLTVSNPDTNISLLSENAAFYVFTGSGAATTGAALNSKGNPALTWEKTTSQNFAVDFGFFDNKLTATIDMFSNETQDLISQDNNLISSTAIDAAAPYVNIGSMETKGFDLSLGYQNETNGLQYGLTANITKADNEVTSLIAEYYSGGTSRMGALTRTAPGYPISSYYGRIVDGIFQNDGEVAAHASQDGAAPGRLRYKDVDGNGVINDLDRTWMGSYHPDFTYGININMAYQNFDLSAFFYGVQGADLFHYTRLYNSFPLFFNGNRTTDVLDSWTPSNPDAAMPALSEAIRNNEATASNSFFVEDGSYLRLRSLQVGYTFPEAINNLIGASSMRLFYSGYNIFTITDYTGMDPEVPFGGTTDLGVVFAQYPTSKSHSIGVNIKF